MDITTSNGSTERILAARAARVMERCERIAACSGEPGAITRAYGSPALASAMGFVEGWMREAGLETRRDAIGNLLGRLSATAPDAPVLVLGSHLDSVRDAGKYDGPLGVLTALDAVEAVAAVRPRAVALEIAAFADEEGLRFHTTYLGSRAYAGRFEPSLLDLVDADGVSLHAACLAAGGDPDRLVAGVALGERLIGYVEVHIEQGPVLDRLGAPLAAVTAIAGQSRIAVTYVGEAGHAGTVPMVGRRDALLGAAELALAAEEVARRTPGLLATVGEIRITPGASNVIPGQAHLSLDVRSPHDERRLVAVADLHQRALAVAGRRGLDLSWNVLQANPTTPMDPALTGCLERAIEEAGLPLHRLPSGAGHDAVILAAVCPAAMLFVRCAGGVSHHPAESVSPGDVAAALAVFDRVLAEVLPTGAIRPDTSSSDSTRR